MRETQQMGVFQQTVEGSVSDSVSSILPGKVIHSSSFASSFALTLFHMVIQSAQNESDPRSIRGTKRREKDEWLSK
jgi:hypothetical protein